jgi:hypothetical protein
MWVVTITATIITDLAVRCGKYLMAVTTIMDTSQDVITAPIRQPELITPHLLPEEAQAEAVAAVVVAG